MSLIANDMVRSISNILKMTSMRERKRPPLHPGQILRADYLEPLALSVSTLARYLGISRQQLTRILNETGHISPDLALRLARTFRTTPNLWLNMQKEYDLWHAAHISQEWQRIEPIEMAIS